MITFNEKFGRKKPSDLALTNVLTYSPKTEKQGGHSSESSFKPHLISQSILEKQFLGFARPQKLNNVLQQFFFCLG